jgi:hypothetical protein
MDLFFPGGRRPRGSPCAAYWKKSLLPMRISTEAQKMELPAVSTPDLIE